MGDSLERALLLAAGPLLAMLVALCGALLVMRRIGGGFAPAGGAGVLAVVVCGGLLVLAVDVAARLAGLPAAWGAAARMGYFLAWAAVGMPPAVGSPADVLLALMATGVAGRIIAEPIVRGRAGTWLADLGRRTRRLPPGWQASRRRVPPATAVAAPTPGHLVQRFERYELDGSDCLRGTLALTVSQGARSAHGHIGFCPTFRQVPHVEATTAYDGVEAVVTVAEIVPWGVRIECRLDEPAEEAVEIPVDVVARAPL